MEGDHFLGRKNKSLHWLKNVEEEDTAEELKVGSIGEPETPKEPLEFLSRSWSISATEISKALALKHPHGHFVPSINNPMIPETVTAQQLSGKVKNLIPARRTRSIGKWFHQKELSNTTIKKKDKARVENARAHAALSIAAMAAALAAVAASENTKSSGSKISSALASASELLASHCAELAESAGNDHDRVAYMVRSAVDIQSPSDLVTLTAAAATALRGEAALKARLPKEGKKNAAISPYDKGMAEAHLVDVFHGEAEEHEPPCIGDLLQYKRNGALQWKRVSIYINKKSQVIIKFKSKHVGGAFSKNNKCVVYGVCDETGAWPFRKERENVEVYFGVKSAQGLLEFKCKDRIHKQKWVDGIQSLLRRNGCVCIEDAEQSLKLLDINKTI